MPEITNIYIWFIILAAGLFVLVKAADYFNKAAEVIGLSFGMSPFVIGILITAIGTSLPELITSVLSVSRGVSEIVPGNVCGSNVANIFLVIGLVAAINKKNIELHAEFINVDLQFLIGSALFAGFCMWDGEFTRLEGLLSLGAFAAFFLYLWRDTRTRREESKDKADAETEKVKARWFHYAQFIVAGIFIWLAAEAVIRSVVFTADYFEIGSGVIAAGVVALGTSLPELVVSLDAIKKGKSDYAIGNILGSSIFNALWVLGFASMFGKITVSDEVRTIVLPFMLAATLLFYLLTRDKIISKWEGWFYVVFYGLFISQLTATVIP